MKKLAITAVLMATSVCMFAMGGSDKDESANVKYTPRGTYPIVEEPITIDIMVNQPPVVEDYNTNEFTKFMEEKTGIKINYIMVPEQAALEKLALTLASGDYPDAFLGFTRGMTNEQQTVYGVEEKLLLPLNEYYNDDMMPNLMDAMESYTDAVGFMTLTDGNIYSLPRLEQTYHVKNQVKMYVYQPFLDALGLEVPTTTEEFYEVLKAIRDDDPNGNGKKDEIPLAGSIIGWSDHVERFLMNSFIYTDLDTDTRQNSELNVGYFLDGDKIDTSVNKDAFRDGLTYMNMLYQEGLVYNGSFTQDSSQLTQLVESSEDPIVGFVTGGWRGQFSSLSGDRFLNFRAIAPLEGPDGVQEAVNYLDVPLTGALALSADTPYAEAILRYFDYMYSMEGTLKQRYGEEGVAWSWAQEGDVGLDGNPAIWKRLKPWNDKDPQNVTFIQGSTYAENNAFRLGSAIPTGIDYYSPENNEKVLYDETHNLYTPYANVELEVPPLKYTGEETENFATVKQELANYIRQSTVKFIVGTLDVTSDEEWSTYLEDLDKLQIEEVLENMQAAYDRQYK